MIKYDVVKAEKYTGRDGQERTKYTPLGRVIAGEKGLSLKLDVTPVGWDGWAYLFEPKPKTERVQAERPARDFDDDIPI